MWTPFSFLRALLPMVVLIALLVPSSAYAEEDAPPSPDPLAAILDRAEEVLAQIQSLRGVHALGPVQRAVRTRDELRRDLIRLIHEEYTPDELAAQNRLLHVLRLLPSDADFIDIMVALLEDQVAGFYDHREQTFYLMREGDMALQEAVMSHELFHAIQDQVWGIEAVQGRGATRITDLGLARSALIEGDALAVMLQYMTGGTVDVFRSPLLETMIAQSVPPTSESLGVPVPMFMWQQLVYPYTAGLSFVLAVGRALDWAGVDAIYTDPPDSTEQVLHPERYLTRDDPTWLEFASWDDAGGEVLAEDILGEFTLRTTLSQLVSDQLAAQAIERAAAGWDGDRLRLRTWADAPERARVTWASVWDDAAEALQFARVASRLAQPWVGVPSQILASGTHGSAWEASSSTAAFRLEQWGDLVVIAYATGTATQDDALHEVRIECDVVFDTLVRSRYPANR